MSASKESDSSAPEHNGVLSNLPRTRPQRASARRVAARKADAATPTTAASAQKTEAPGTRARSNGRPPAGSNGGQPAAPPRAAKRASKPSPAPSASARSKQTRSASKPARRQARAATEPVPRQGFECEEHASGAVRPPGGTELVASAAEIVGELAKAGVSTGERLFKDVLSRLPLS